MNVAYLLINTASNNPDRIAIISIVLKHGKMVDEQEVIDFYKSHLASYKKPRAIEFVSSIPKNPSGKPLKRLLKDYDQKGGGGQKVPDL